MLLFLVVSLLDATARSWALTMQLKADYAPARVWMSLFVTTEQVVTARIVANSWVMVATSLALSPVAGTGLLDGLARPGGGRCSARGPRTAARVGEGLLAHCGRLFRPSMTDLSPLAVVVALENLVPALWR